MKAFTIWMEKYFVPVAAKIGAQRHLVAIRDAFIGIMPITMAGSVAVLLNVFFRDLPGEWGFDSFVNMMQPIIEINGNVWWGTISILSLAFVFALGYNLAKSYDVNPLGGGIVAFASLIATIPASTPEIGGWGYIAGSYINASGLFTALIIGLISTMIFVKLINTKLTIKLPDSVPPAVSKAFMAIIPGTIAIYFSAVVAFICTTFAGMPLNDLVSKYIQTPFLALSQGYVSVLIITIAVSVLWFFGLHGPNVLAPILDGTYITALSSNMSAFQEGVAVADLPYIWTRGSFDAFVWLGGSGCTIALVIAILLVGKLKGQRAVAKVAAPMSVFNINEPVMFGVPIVLNPIYFIPFVIISPILVTIAFFATSMGLIPPVFLQIPWIMPPIIYAYLATGGSLMAGLVALINLIIATVIWAAFVLVANRAGE